MRYSPGETISLTIIWNDQIETFLVCFHFKALRLSTKFALRVSSGAGVSSVLTDL